MAYYVVINGSKSDPLSLVAALSAWRDVVDSPLASDVCVQDARGKVIVGK